MKILLKQSGNGLPVATIEVGEVYTPNKPLETLKCYGTSQLEHPGERRERERARNLHRVAIHRVALFASPRYTLVATMIEQRYV